VLRHAEDAFLDRLQAILATQAPPLRAVDELLVHSPLVRRLYLVSRRGELLYPGTWRDGDAAVFGPLIAEAAKGKFERGGKREVVAGHQICLAMIMKRGGEPVLAAFIRDSDALRREILELSLYSFKYAGADAVVAYAPPTKAKGKTLRTVAFLRRDDWQPALEHPLGLTLPPRPVSMPGNLTEQEQQIARTIALYDYRFQPLGDGSLVLVAAPIQG